LHIENGNYVVGDTRKPAGWLRLPNSLLANIN